MLITCCLSVWVDTFIEELLCFWALSTKGQFIAEVIFVVFMSSKKQTKMFWRISFLAFKMGQANKTWN